MLADEAICCLCLTHSMCCADARVADLEQEGAALEDKLAAMVLRAEAAEGEKAKLAEGLMRKGHEQEEASDAALQALAEKRCALLHLVGHAFWDCHKHILRSGSARFLCVVYGTPCPGERAL